MVGILSYHLAIESSHQGRSERKILLVGISIEGVRRIETSPLLCPSAHITRLVTTIWDRDTCLWLCYWGSSYSTGASSGISQWDIVWHSSQVSHLWQINVLHCASLSTMEALHFGEGNNHPQRPPTPSVHTDIREVTERSPSEAVHISATVSFEHQVQEG